MNALAQLLQAPGASIEADGDLDAVNTLVMEKGWGDGLPVVPPTEARVAAMLEYCDRPWDQPVAKIPPRWGEATPLRLAANAVMAGCEPRHFPLYLLAIEAMCEEPLNLYGVQATTHLCAPLVIVNGPVAKELGINSGHNAFGPGNRANATIGRAIRLALLNIGGAIPALGDMSTFGSPAKYSYLVAENEDENPWDPLHVERGLPREASAVTVIGAECPHNVNDHESLDGEGLLTTIAGTMAVSGSNDIYYKAQPLVIMGPEHARTIAASYSKQEAKRFLQQHATLPVAKLSRDNIERRVKITWKERLPDPKPDDVLYAVQRPEDLLIAVIGGAGKHSAVVPTFGATLPVTRALKTKDGRLAKSVEDFRQR
jgi:hypothetical protein